MNLAAIPTGCRILVRGSSSLTTNLKELNEGTKNDLNVPFDYYG